MSLGNIKYDTSAIYQSTADARDVYAYVVNNIASYRPYPLEYGIGVLPNVTGNAQNNVDLESLLRNQQFITSKNPQYRISADACFIPFIDTKVAPGCVSGDLTPRVEYINRSCNPISEITIDRFDFLNFATQGFKMAYPIIPENTVLRAKDEIERSRKY